MLLWKVSYTSIFVEAETEHEAINKAFKKTRKDMEEFVAVKNPKLIGTILGVEKVECLGNLYD